MTSKQIHIGLNYCIASVWFINGLLCKVLNLVPRHAEIVARILGDVHAQQLSIAIGIAEIFMAIWIITGFLPRINAILQISIVASMNCIEFIMVPDLLLWGKMNLFFAFIFILIIYYNTFILRKKRKPLEHA